MIRRNLAAVILFACSWSIAAAETIRVPHDHKSIQAAINFATPGDTLLVEAGTYHERLRLKPHPRRGNRSRDEQHI